MGQVQLKVKLPEGDIKDKDKGDIIKTKDDLKEGKLQFKGDCQRYLQEGIFDLFIEKKSMQSKSDKY